MGSCKKILVVSHGHPEHNPGGGEIAAYNLHGALNNATCFSSVFFARHGDPSLLHGGTAFSGTGRSDEILFYSTMPDWFRYSQPNKALVWRDFREVLELHKPDIVHFHHYIHLGLELIREVRNYNSELPIVLTLHEYMGICNNDGQMLKTQDGSLCYSSAPAACAKCFPERTSQDFFLREQFIKSHFSLVDQFVSPSRFLRDRYIAWGLPAEKILVIENMLSNDDEAIVDHTPSDKIRFAFYGQINRFKGVEVLLDALQSLPKRVLKQIQVDINGSGLEYQSNELQVSLRASVAKLGTVVRLRGRYTPSELPTLLQSTDWMVIPSKWWENSPVVILEARKYGVPVICADIGGMAEKVEHGITGRHFLARRAESLAEQLVWAVENREQRADYAHAMQQSYNCTDSIDSHITLYKSLTDNLGEDTKIDKIAALRAA